MVFENSWLNHLKEEILLDWFLSGIKKWEKDHSLDDNYSFNQLKEDVMKEIKKLEKKCPQCLKIKIEKRRD